MAELEIGSGLARAASRGRTAGGSDTRGCDTLKMFLNDQPSWLHKQARGLAGRRLRRVSTDSDLAQEAAVEGLSHSGPTVSQPRAYLTRILHRVAARRGARASREEGLSSPDALPLNASTPSQKAARGEQIRRSLGALGELPSAHQRIISLRILKGWSFRECAKLLGCSEASARMTFHRALLKLRSKLGHD